MGATLNALSIVFAVLPVFTGVSLDSINNLFRFISVDFRLFSDIEDYIFLVALKSGVLKNDGILHHNPKKEIRWNHALPLHCTYQGESKDYISGGSYQPPGDYATSKLTNG